MKKYSMEVIDWLSGSKTSCLALDDKVSSTNKDNTRESLNIINGTVSSREVQAIWYDGSSTPIISLSQGLSLKNLFPNLTKLGIDDCGLRVISKTDLLGLEKLEELRLINNQLRSLPNDLLANMKNLKWISFHGNKIEFMDSKMFDGIKHQLEHLNLRSNYCINACFQRKSKQSVDEFMSLIDSECSRPRPVRGTENFREKASIIFENLWLTGRFSDFTIVVDEKVFKVHKNVLAMQSEVFAKMLFENDSEESKTLMIPDFSSAAIGNFLRYLYTGKMHDEANFMELFSLASSYKIEDLKLLASKHMLEDIDEVNSVEFLEYALVHEAEVLREKSFECIKRAHPGIIFKDTWKRKPDAVRNVIEAKEKYDSIVEGARKELEAVMNRE